MEKYRDIFNKAEVLNINGGVTKLSANLLMDIVTLIPNLKEISFSSKLKEISWLSLIQLYTTDDSKENYMTITIPDSVDKITNSALCNPPTSNEKLIFKLPQWMQNGVENNSKSIVHSDSSEINITYIPNPDGKEYYAVWDKDTEDREGNGYWVKTLKEETPTTEPTETTAADAE